MNSESSIEHLQQQLVDMQSQLAFQEDAISALDSVVTRQQRQLEHFQEVWEKQNALLDRLSSELEQKGLVEAPPPHY